MAEFELIMSVAALFMVRIGIPFVALITLGTLVDRWQRKQEQSFS